MKYRMYTGDQEILRLFREVGVVSSQDLKSLQRQEFQADSDDEAVNEVRDFMHHAGIPVRVITRIGTQGEEIIVHRFGN